MARQTSLKLVKEALRAKKGNVYLASKMLGITRTALHRRIERHVELQEIKKEFDAVLIDVAEGGLFNALAKEQPWAIKYALSTKGRVRGYKNADGKEDIIVPVIINYESPKTQKEDDQ